MLNTNDSTLAQMAAFLTNTCNAEVSPQAVDQKIQDAGKEFLRICLTKALELSLKRLDIDISIKIGNLNCRLVGKKLPDNVVNEKLRRAHKEATRKGRTVTEKYKIFLKFGLFITNLQKSFTFDNLFILYRLRWQIELIFKTWKSILGIHKIRSARENRVLSEVYGKLIIAALSNIIYWKIKMDYSVVLSYHKILQYIKPLAINWTTSILSGNNNHLEFLKYLKQQIVRFCKKNKQKNKPYVELMLEYMDVSENKQLTT